jgi:hypothetical protein
MKLALSLLLLFPAQDLKKGVLKAEDAGPDYKIQGEYKGAGWGAQVVAKGDGKFDVYLLKGGLPGDGWDQATRTKAAATTADGKVTFPSGTIDGQKLTTADAVLEKVERTSPTLGAKPPEGAVIPEFLAKGKDAQVVDGVLNSAGTGGFFSKAKYGNVKLHIEFMLSFMPHAGGQGRSNSGVYLAGRHECQVLDSFGLTGENNECGGIYTIAKPKVNMCFPPLRWQTYDIEYRLAADGKPATMSVLHNGVEIHKDVACGKKTTSSVDGGAESTPGPLHMQDHGNPVLYRNIWIVELK